MKEKELDLKHVNEVEFKEALEREEFKKKARES